LEKNPVGHILIYFFYENLRNFGNIWKADNYRTWHIDRI
jgi:hypothetical protein